MQSNKQLFNVSSVTFNYSFKCLSPPVTYLECAKGEGPGVLGTEVPQWGPGAKPR